MQLRTFCFLKRKFGNQNMNSLKVAANEAYRNYRKAFHGSLHSIALQFIEDFK